MSKQTNILLFKDTFDYSIPSPRGLSTKTGLGIASTTPCLFRTFSATTSLRSAADLEFQIGKITDLYTEAKDELEYAVEARGTTYYNEDKAGAAEAVEAVLSAYKSAQDSLPEAQKADLERRIGLKVLELRAQFDELTKEDIEGDDH